MATFNFSRLEQFAGNSTSIKRPREFGYFSYDDDHVLKPLSAESLSYYYPPTFGAPGTSDTRPDLSTGFATFRKRDDSIDEHLDGLLDTLQLYEERLLEKVQSGECELRDVRVKADIVTYRGMMTKAGIPCYHFEILSVLPKPWADCTREEIECRESKVVSNHAQYCSIARTSIGTTSLILAGEVDAVLGEKPENSDTPIPWVELKTSAEPNFNTPRGPANYERKLLKYWAQSFLLGVPKIMVGYRTQDGHLTRIEELDTQRIPSQVKRGIHSWDGNICINLSAAFLEMLKQTVVGDGVWRIRRAKNVPAIEIVKVAETGTGEILKAGFKEHREKLRALEISAALG
ncbi:decapping endonuclease targeting mRNA [Recurvomyces mirabilis]|uniref:Decapping nuclease n=1 Tax=Recurvomyces mirabilis TaxID=574656 RepID=A0AAE0WRI3_9PEZI|nr:decapping endonuclease targeting mRNA [Recurvomyces mirabilis]KAK5154881.1 decapping endonuclease targeting mRNA [Recurvomyces mirabilis]